jgi:putative ABC transport system ATP-binding protein
MTLVTLHNLKPAYISAKLLVNSKVYLQEQVCFESGTTYIIEATSGKGKSSLLNIIYGVHKQYEGKLTYNGIDATRIKRDQISYVFQDLKLFNELSAWENVTLKNGITSHKSVQQMEELFESFGLEPQMHQSAATLSLGQQQRVAIIRGLCMPYKLLLLDEPFSHLDDENVRIIMEIIKKDSVEQQASVLIASLGNSDLIAADHILEL